MVSRMKSLTNSLTHTLNSRATAWLVKCYAPSLAWVHMGYDKNVTEIECP